MADCAQSRCILCSKEMPAKTSVDGLHRPPLALTGLTAFIQVEDALSSKEQMLLGMQMFQLTEIEIIHEPLTDTKVSPLAASFVICW